MEILLSFYGLVLVSSVDVYVENTCVKLSKPSLSFIERGYIKWWQQRDIEKPTRSQKREAREVYEPRSDGQRIYKPRSDGKKSTKLRSDG